MAEVFRLESASVDVSVLLVLLTLSGGELTAGGVALADELVAKSDTLAVALSEPASSGDGEDVAPEAALDVDE